MCCRRSAGDLVGPASCDVRPVSRCSLYCNFDRFGSSRLSCDMVRELLLVARHGPPPPAPQRNPQIRNRRQCNIITGFKNHRQSRARDESHADATPTRGRARSATRPRRGGAVPPGPGAGGAVSPERDRIGAGAAASDAGPRPPAQRPPPVPRDAIVRSSMGSLVDRACSGYTKTKKLNEAGERSAPAACR